MAYVTTCFYCQKSLMMRESILVKASLTREILCRFHPECWAKLTEPVAQARLEYEQIKGQMRNGLSFPTSSRP